MRENTMNYTIGIDLGDKSHQVCVLSYSGKVRESCRILNTRETIEAYFKRYLGSTVVLEAGGQSSWISHLLEKMGMTVLVGNPRRLRMIWNTERKDDIRDAQMLARMGRFDPELLSPIEHRSIETQIDLNLVKARDLMVRSRTRMINFTKGILKQYGIKVPVCSAPSFHTKVEEVIPDELAESLASVVETIAHMTCAIRSYEKQIEELCETKYPETRIVRQVRGVGSITALAFVLIVGDPDRFKRSRDIGAYLGLIPRRSQSGETEKHLQITKAGNPYLRRLLVSSAQYILGPFGEDCDLRRYGERISARGGSSGKRKAVVAVARKLGILLHALLRSCQEYDPLKHHRKRSAVS